MLGSFCIWFLCFVFLVLFVRNVTTLVGVGEWAYLILIKCSGMERDLFADDCRRNPIFTPFFFFVAEYNADLGVFDLHITLLFYEVSVCPSFTL